MKKMSAAASTVPCVPFGAHGEKLSPSIEAKPTRMKKIRMPTLTNTMMVFVRALSRTP
jgi:hypothetical protein